jgi:hypothetical protein
MKGLAKAADMLRPKGKGTRYGANISPYMDGASPMEKQDLTHSVKLGGTWKA